MYAALANYMDAMVGDLVQELKAKQMYENAIIVFSSDNGGDGAANNYPLRGAKFSNWEGGIRVPALVSGGAVPSARRGLKLHGLTAIWDLYATFGEAAGLSREQAVEDSMAVAPGLPGVESLSHWSYWLREGRAPRRELAIGGALGNSRGASDLYIPTTVEGLIVVENETVWKILHGYSVQEAIWTGPQFPNSSTKSSIWDTAVDCTLGCLYKGPLHRA